MTSRIALALVLVLEAGCAHALRSALRAPDLSAPPALANDHFNRDRAGGVSEEGLRAILDAPVYLDETQRLGVLPVAESYRPERGVPLPAVPAELTRSLEAAGLFQATSEVSTDWPIDGDIPGLRELAARYRSGYLLLYRERFVDDGYVNAWAWLYPTIVGALVAPSRTVETAGVLEATLFDVRTGTILFTVYERVHAVADETPWAEDRKLRAMKLRLLDQAAGKLGEQLVSKVRRLAALRPAKDQKPVAAEPQSDSSSSSSSERKNPSAADQAHGELTIPRWAVPRIASNWPCRVSSMVVAPSSRALREKSWGLPSRSSAGTAANTPSCAEM